MNNFSGVAAELRAQVIPRDQLVREVQTRLIEPICKRFDIAFIIHPQYDEATFVGKDGVWYRPSWGGATDVMSNAKDAEMREAIQVCWHAFRENRLITAQGTPRIESYEGGIAPDIRDKVIDRLGYMACCP